MTTKEILKHLNAAKFFATYLPHIKRYKYKMREKDSHGKELLFTEAEKQQIIEAIQQFAQDVKK